MKLYRIILVDDEKGNVVDILKTNENGEAIALSARSNGRKMDF